MAQSMSSVRGLILACGLAGACAGAARASVVYVDDSSPANGPGSTWATAFDNLQDALAAAEASAGAITEIRVAQGVYFPDIGVGVTPGDRAAPFEMVSGVSVRGGYAGFGAPNPDARDPASFITILSGDLSGNDGPAFANNGENAFQVVHATDLPLGATLDGLTIERGNRTGATTIETFFGGGIQAIDADLTLIDCVLRLNVGGAVYAEASNLSATDSDLLNNSEGIDAWLSDVTLDNCAVDSNTGGGVRVDQGDLDASDCLFNANANRAVSVTFGNTTLSGCMFSGNTSNGLNGAAFFADMLGTNAASFTNCQFTANDAGGNEGGAVYLNGGSTHTFSGCDFSGNTARRAGALKTPRSRISDCTFTDNHAVGPFQAHGGAIECAIATLVRCEFDQNTAVESGGALYSTDGGAQFTSITNCRFTRNQSLSDRGGAVYVNRVAMTNCLVVGNSAYLNGGGIDANAIATIAHCTIVGNTSTLTDGDGVALYPNCLIRNCILWDNGGSAQVNQINLEDFGADYNCVQGLDGTLGGTGNIGGDPLFVNADGFDNIYGTSDDDLRVFAGSPVIDAASNTLTPADIADLDGDLNVAEKTPLDAQDQPRFFDDPDTIDTGVGPAPIADMGAFEFDGTTIPPCPGDATGDNLVNFDDLNVILSFWQQAVPPGTSGDLDGSGAVDFSDLNIVLTFWEQHCI